MLASMPVPVVPPAQHTGHRDTPAILPARVVVKPVAGAERRVQGDGTTSSFAAPPSGHSTGLGDARGEDPPPPSPPRDSYPRAPPVAI